jgi:hypothetical protein
MSNHHLTLFFVLTTVAGCTSDDDTSASVSGQAVYRDAATEHDGAPRTAATPASQDAQVSIIVKGTGQIPQLDPKCALDPAGVFEARYLSTTTMKDGDIYTATVASGELQTPSGCAIPELTIGVITDVVVRGELTITTANCQSFCDASARADAEAQCGATSTAATCRAQYEAQASARCQTTCTTEARAIVAETSLSATLLGGLDADALRAAALGELTADLTFDHLEDEDGKTP